MIRAFRAEMLKLRRPAVIWTAGAIAPAFALVGTILDFATASTEDSRPASPNGVQSVLTTTTQLAHPGGLTLGFSNASGFIGILVFVLYAVNMSSEFGHGTLRALLVREPHRARLVVGKETALLAFTAVALLVAEIVGALTALALAPTRDISTHQWFTASGLADAAGHYGNAFFTAALFGLSGSALGALLRSTPVALGVGLAWLGPLEHILQISWTGAGRWLPGLLYTAVGLGGSDVASYQRALLLGAGYTVVVLLAGSTALLRRDVNA